MRSPWRLEWPARFISFADYDTKQCARQLLHYLQLPLQQASKTTANQKTFACRKSRKKRKKKKKTTRKSINGEAIKLDFSSVVLAHRAHSMLANIAISLSLEFCNTVYLCVAIVIAGH